MVILICSTREGSWGTRGWSPSDITEQSIHHIGQSIAEWSQRGRFIVRPIQSVESHRERGRAFADYHPGRGEVAIARPPPPSLLSLYHHMYESDSIYSCTMQLRIIDT